KVVLTFFNLIRSPESFRGELNSLIFNRTNKLVSHQFCISLKDFTANRIFLFYQVINYVSRGDIFNFLALFDFILRTKFIVRVIEKSLCGLLIPRQNDGMTAGTIKLKFTFISNQEQVIQFLDAFCAGITLLCQFPSPPHMIGRLSTLFNRQFLCDFASNRTNIRHFVFLPLSIFSSIIPCWG